MRARTSFASKEIANGPSRGKRKHRGRLLGDGDMARTRAHGTGRNPHRGREALSPRGVLYAWTWPEMAREARRGARLALAVSARFGCHRRLPMWPCLPQYCLEMIVPGSALHAG